MSTKQQLLKVLDREEALDLIREVLHSPYDIAFWRLPNESTYYALIDLSQDHTPGKMKDLEDLQECFIINPYAESHPPKPLILQGHIIITISGDQADLKFQPTLSDQQIDRFYQTINQTFPSRLTVTPSENTSGNNFEQQVTSAIAEIKKGQAKKIVLSRYEDHPLRNDFDAVRLFERLASNYPNACCHLTQTVYGLWLGATPERLISVTENRYFSTDALAGTQPLGENDPLTQVGWTQKEIEEQAMVSRYIIDCLKQIRLREFEEIGPKTVRAGNLAHLKTEYKVDMEETNSPRLGSTMLELLHPTSAVCGYPRDAANEFIYETEQYDRELYAGFLGPVGFNGGNTQLYVNLRCMKVMKGVARLYAGAGITEDSIPEKEFAETQYKLQTLLKVLQQ